MNDILSEKEYQHFIMQKLHDENGYVIRSYRDGTNQPPNYDARFAMDRELFFQFLEKTQPEALAALRKVYKEQTEDTIIGVLNREVTQKRGSLVHSLKHGIQVGNQKLDLMYTKPASNRNPKLTKLYEQSIFSVMEEVWADEQERIDLVIFLNGIAIISFELKCNLAGQSYHDAIKQYRTQRDPKNRLFLFKAGCLVNFAMDLREVYMATRLSGPSTYFLPFNRGKGHGHARGAGNDIDPETGLGVTYMWKDILQKDTILNLISKYIFVEVKEKEDAVTGKKKRSETLIFPRYHQLECVRNLLLDVKENGSSRNYLIEHSAGSGKTNSITWLAHQLASLHDDRDQIIFDNVIIVTDRVIVDRQLQRAVLALDHKDGFIQVMDDSCTSADLERAVQGHTKIIGTTIQKFPYIVNAVRNLKKKHFAVIIDEAHSSTAGKDMAAVMQALGSGEEEEEEGSVDDLISKEIASSGKPDNVSFFAFTATPKPTTLLLFGTLNPQGQYEAFHLYSMKQAIEEGFILDVLSNYVTYKTFYEINKTIQDDPEYVTSAAKAKINRFARLHPTNIAQRIEIIIEHFRTSVMDELGGEAKAMVVTSSRLEAVRYKKAFEEYIQRKGYTDIKALVAFSGKVKNQGKEYSEAGMNGIPESRTAEVFDTKEYQVLLVANKYQTGFDQPKLCAMYILKKLQGVNAVQTLSRLNRICPPYDKKIFILDFVNTYEDIQKAFAPYYEATILSNSVTPQQIYDLSVDLDSYYILDPDDIEKFNALLYSADGSARKVDAGGKRKMLYYLQRAKGMWDAKKPVEREEIRMKIKRFIRFYEFILLVTCFADVELHKKYRFLSYLLPMLEPEQGKGFNLDDKIKAFNFVQKKTGEHKDEKPTGSPLVKLPTAENFGLTESKKEKLSSIIASINARMGTSFDADVATKSILQIRDLLAKSPKLKKTAMNNTENNFALAYSSSVDDALLDGLSQNEDFYSMLLNNPDLKKEVLGMFSHEIYQELRGEKAENIPMAAEDRKIEYVTH